MAQAAHWKSRNWSRKSFLLILPVPVCGIVDEHDVVGHPPLGDLGGQERAQIIGADIDASLAHHDQQGRSSHRMEHADRGGFGHGGMAHGGVFQLDRADPFAARLDDVLGPVGQLQRAVGMDYRNVAGIEPLAGIDGFLALEVALDHPGPRTCKAPAVLPSRGRTIPDRPDRRSASRRRTAPGPASP
jgi:hypothetical protein